MVREGEADEERKGIRSPRWAYWDGEEEAVRQGASVAQGKKGAGHFVVRWQR